jgi:site-specific DNA-cytosine methylase
MLKIQGFPDWYQLTGTKTEQKKHIGNSVEVKVGVALFQAIDKQIQTHAA